MTHFFKQSFKFVALLLMAFLVGCGDDDGNAFDTPTDGGGGTVDPTSILRITEGGAADDNLVATATGVAGSTVPGQVIYTSTTKQKRMYITQNISGQGDVPFNNFNLNDTDLKKALKADGSIDLDGATKNEINFTFDLPVPDTADAEIVYSFWTTSGKGDFRDPSKRLLLGVGTITVTVGNGFSGNAMVSSYAGIKLAAPAADGTSSSFFSLLNGQTYKISEGIEYASFWDFGYFHLDSTGANLASTSDYNTAVVDVATKSGTPSEELNKAYFKMASGIDFDAISTANELSSLSVSDSDAETISGLAKDDIVEFVDQYGKKGLIRVVEVVPGFSPALHYITIDIKVQP